MIQPVSSILNCWFWSVTSDIPTMAAVQTPLENASNFNGPQPQPLPQPQPMQPEAPPAQLPVIGIIYPPPEVRSILLNT